MAEKRLNRVWILEHNTSEGWLPSIDHAFPWRTKKAAQRKLKSLGGELSKNYRIVRYNRAAKP